jgi:hypothetical protein
VKEFRFLKKEVVPELSPEKNGGVKDEFKHLKLSDHAEGYQSDMYKKDSRKAAKVVWKV